MVSVDGFDASDGRAVPATASVVVASVVLVVIVVDVMGAEEDVSLDRGEGPLNIDKRPLAGLSVPAEPGRMPLRREPGWVVLCKGDEPPNIERNPLGCSLASDEAGKALGASVVSVEAGRSFWTSLVSDKTG